MRQHYGFLLALAKGDKLGKFVKIRENCWKTSLFFYKEIAYNCIGLEVYLGDLGSLYIPDL